MTLFARCSILLACLSLTMTPGCRNRGGNGGGDELPANVQKSVDEVVAQLESTSKAVGGSVEALTNVDQDDDGEIGDCPELVFVRQDNVTSIGVTFEAGCSSEYYEKSVSGTISAEFDRNAGTFSAIFDEFTVEGQTTDGELNVTRVAAGDIRNWNGTIDISTSSVGSVVGDIVFEINILTDTLTISSASLNVTNSENETRSVEVDGVVIRPVANNSFVPQSGTVTFEIPNLEEEGPESITVVVEFDANSPDDGTVKVIFGEGTVENYPLGNF